MRTQRSKGPPVSPGFLAYCIAGKGRMTRSLLKSIPTIAISQPDNLGSSNNHFAPCSYDRNKIIRYSSFRTNFSFCPTVNGQIAVGGTRRVDSSYSIHFQILAWLWWEPTSRRTTTLSPTAGIGPLADCPQLTCNTDKADAIVRLNSGAIGSECCDDGNQPCCCR